MIDRPASGNAGDANGDLRLPDPALMARLAVSDNGFVFDPVSGNSFTLNAAGLALFRIFLHHRKLDDVFAEVTASFEVKPHEAERDILEFAAQLCANLKP
ncbi:MAG TPA: PqqD family protein [Geothrix sp.]|jgi:hypothetical protein